MSGGGQKKCQMTNLTIPNNFCYMKYAEKSFPGLPDVGVLHGDGDGPMTPSQMSGEVMKKFQMTNFSMPNNSCTMKYALKSVPGLADVGVPQGDWDGPRTPPRCQGGPEKNSND